jgi:hypothetical protein
MIPLTGPYRQQTARASSRDGEALHRVVRRGRLNVQSNLELQSNWCLFGSDFIRQTGIGPRLPQQQHQ